MKMTLLQLVLCSVVADVPTVVRRVTELVAELTSGHFDARMSKIINDSLTRPGTGCFIGVPIRQQWATQS